MEKLVFEAVEGAYADRNPLRSVVVVAAVRVYDGACSVASACLAPSSEELASLELGDLPTNQVAGMPPKQSSATLR